MTGPNDRDAELARLTAELLGAFQHNDERVALRVLEGAIASGIDAPSIYLGIFQPALDQVGLLWETGQASVGEEHRATAMVEWLMKALWEDFQPPTRRSGNQTILASCVRNERHDVGLTMVCDFLRLDGWQVVDLGADTPEGEIAQIANDFQASACLLSASQVETLEALSETIAELRALVPDRPILVGGRIFRIDPTAAGPEGASAVARDANEALQQVRRLLVP